MLLTEYFARFVKVIEEYLKTHLITDSGLSIDCRTEKIGIIKGKVTWYATERAISLLTISIK
ncbi:MAG: hypothetical protein E3K40_15025 [Candidatus Brocadia sp.]|nr:hypothetical protein [Candidatus Brocadia sp.]MDG6027982.1 hypothetical protein [Candidatus Brocadia sp.]